MRAVRTIKVTAIAAIAVTQLFAASAMLGGHSSTHGYAGTWAAVDCATWWEEGPDGHLVDCNTWGDGSIQTLTIGRGDAPRVTYQDAYASYCANNESPSTRWVAAGTGYYDGGQLWPVFSKSGCGAFGQGGYAGAALYHDPGSDTLWEDPDGDGWGLVWYRRT